MTKEQKQAEAVAAIRRASARWLEVRDEYKRSRTRQVYCELDAVWREFLETYAALQAACQ